MKEKPVRSSVAPPLPIVKIVYQVDEPKKPESIQPEEVPSAPWNRDSILDLTHRLMGSRQSLRRTERSRQRRQPKRGRGSQSGKPETN